MILIFLDSILKMEIKDWECKLFNISKSSNSLFLYIISGINLNGENVDRVYTHVFEEDEYFEIPIKIYRPNVHPQFPNGG